MIACIAPSDRFYEENISTLSYATRASHIANAPTKNIDPKIREILELKRKNKVLQLELQNANKHIEYLTSLTSEKLQTFGNSLLPDDSKDADKSAQLIETASPIKSRSKQSEINSAIIPGTSIGGGVSMGTMSNQNHLYNTGMSTQTDLRSPIPGKMSQRGKSIDPLSIINKRESIEDIHNRKQFEEKMKLITSEIANISQNRKEDSSRFTDAMTRVTDLLKVNQMLRDESNGKEDIINKKNIQVYQVNEENEELRDRIELLETIVQSDSSTFEKYVSSNLLEDAQKNNMGEYLGFDEGCVQIDSVYVELTELRRIVKKLEKRNKHLERQNMENQYQMHFIGNNEPSRPIMKNNGEYPRFTY